MASVETRDVSEQQYLALHVLLRRRVAFAFQDLQQLQVRSGGATGENVSSPALSGGRGCKCPVGTEDDERHDTTIGARSTPRRRP